MLIRGVGLHAPLEATGGLMNVGNAGTLMRLLPGWLAGQPGGVWTLDGDDSIRQRPVDRIAEPLERMGASVEAREGRFPPFTVRGAELTGIEYDLPVPSAQVKSCVLIAGMLASGSTTVTEGSMSRDHTERMMRRARVPFERDGLRITVAQVDELELDQVVVPGDPSSAAFIVAAAVLVSGSRVVVKDVGLNWTRTGFYRIAERMGAVIVGELEEPGAEADGEPVGELDVASGSLEGTVVEPEEVPLAIDELTLVALLGAHAEGETVVRGAEELRLKESDRIEGVVEGLRGLGADIEATPDGFTRPRRRLTAARRHDRRQGRSPDGDARRRCRPGVDRGRGGRGHGRRRGVLSGLRARSPGAVVGSAPVYDTLLFFHLLAAFLLAVTVVTYTAVALGAPATGRTLFVADRCWDVGGLGTLVLGIWLALNLDQYEFWDGWILGAIALWFVATGLGPEHAETAREDSGADIAVMHWLRTLTVLGLLVLMIWKPGA